MEEEQQGGGGGDICSINNGGLYFLVYATLVWRRPVNHRVTHSYKQNDAKVYRQVDHITCEGSIMENHPNFSREVDHGSTNWSGDMQNDGRRCTDQLPSKTHEILESSQVGGGYHAVTSDSAANTTSYPLRRTRASRAGHVFFKQSGED